MHIVCLSRAALQVLLAVVHVKEREEAESLLVLEIRFCLTL